MLRALFLSAVLSFSASALTLPQAGSGSVKAVWKGLEDCGLKVVDAYDPHLPRPQVPADLAIVVGNSRVLAYYLETYGFGITQLFKNPNGGMVHSVSYNRDEIRWVTPLAGTIAHANRFMTVGGPGFNLYCHSTPLYGDGAEAAFKACVQHAFVDVIVRQLCSFAAN
jgi:hypothetical protein